MTNTMRPDFATLLLTGIALLVAGCTALTPTAQPAPIIQPTEVAAADGDDASGLLPPSAPPFSTGEWKTDFTHRAIAWEEVISGGPPKDGIPAIDEPTFESVAAAAAWLSDRDPVIVFAEAGDVRAYPLAILIWHEIVNDVVSNRPVAVTYCPLCNASIVFDREFRGQVLDFGTTGKLRTSDLIMYDRQTETWWQQFTGEGIVGQFAGEQPDFLTSQVISFADFVAEFPDGQVLARPGLSRSHGVNPYTGYDSSTQPFLFRGEVDDRLPATERVVGVALPGLVKAYPFTLAALAGVIHDEVGRLPLVILHKAGTASALDANAISEGRDVGSVAAFDRRLDGRVLTFVATDDGVFMDEATGSTWNILGEAVAGELSGAQLNRLLAFDHFWFAWAAFHPETELYNMP